MRTTTTPPTYTPTAAARWFPRLPILPPAPLLNCATFTSRNPAWRISSCTTLEGACANELEDFPSPAGARCSCRSPQLRSFAAADFLAADDVRVYLRPGDGDERLHAHRIKSLLLPGIMAISMVFTGVWAVAMPLISEFQFSHEIEDRLLAPMEISWVAVEKVVAGMLQALAAGLVVIPAGWLLLRPGVELSFHTPLIFIAVALLVALFSAS